MSSGSSPNPYKPVAPTSQTVSRSRHSNKLKPPAICQIVVGSLGLLIVFVIWALTAIGAAASPELGTPPPDIVDPAERTGFFVGYYGSLIFPPFNMLSQIITIIGGICMLTQKSIATARTGAVLSVIPCLSSLCFLGIPFGVWSLIVLADPNVTKCFRKR